MKVIDLLNKIANGEIPKKIKFDNRFYTFDEKKDNYYENETCSINWDYVSLHCLNEKVEILEEENKKCTVETCCIGIEGLSKALLKIKDDMKSIYENIDEVEILEEEKKIPEKLNWKPKESMAGQLTQKEQIEVIARRTEKLKKEFNNLLDYLKSKGE